jgi:CheY-like chemotaxis protein
MSQSAPSEIDPQQATANSPASTEELKHKVKETIEAARDTIARSNQTAERTRKVVQKTEEIFQHHRARQEREAEQPSLRAPTGSLPSPDTPTQSLKLIEILLVEDNPGDIRLFREVLKDCKRTVRLSVLSTGGDVLPFLHQEGAYTQAPRPTLIFLDLELPVASGASVLAAIRSHPHFANIPVVILSGLPAAKGREQALEDAQGYIDKNMPMWEFFYTINTLLERL